jgi:ribonuclease Z
MTTRISRALVALASLLFAVVALAIWAAPAPAAHALGLEPIRPGGAAVIRTDLGGLFAGLSLLCAAAARTRRSSWSLAAAAIVGAIVVGRTLGWISNRRIGADLPELLIELVLVAALLALARSAAEPASSASRRRLRTAIPLIAVGIVSLAGTTALVSPRVQQRIFEAAAGRRAATINAAPLADDALRVAICGSSAPLPSVDRAKACVAVFAGAKFYVVDVGPESVENLVTWGIPLFSSAVRVGVM